MTYLVEGEPGILASLIKYEKNFGVWENSVEVWGVTYSIVICTGDPEDDGNVDTELCIRAIRKLFPGRKVIDPCDLPPSAFGAGGHRQGRQYNGGSGPEEAATLL